MIKKNRKHSLIKKNKHSHICPQKGLGTHPEPSPRQQKKAHEKQKKGCLIYLLTQQGMGLRPLPGVSSSSSFAPIPLQGLPLRSSGEIGGVWTNSYHISMGVIQAYSSPTLPQQIAMTTIGHGYGNSHAPFASLRITCCCAASKARRPKPERPRQEWEHDNPGARKLTRSGFLTKKGACRTAPLIWAIDPYSEVRHQPLKMAKM